MMKCTNPSMITEGDLMDIIDQTASSAVMEHVAHCVSCQNEVEQLKETQALFSISLDRFGCPPAEDLLLFDSGFLTSAEAKSVQTHLTTCASCQAELRQITAVSPELTIISPPPIWEKLLEQGRRLINAIAVAQPQPAVALRGRSVQTLHFETDIYSIRIVRRPPQQFEEHWQVEGRILSKLDVMQEIDGSANLWHASDIIQSAPFNEFGQFSFAGLQSDTYHIELNVDSESILLAPILIT